MVCHTRKLGTGLHCLPARKKQKKRNIPNVKYCKNLNGSVYMILVQVPLQYLLLTKKFSLWNKNTVNITVKVHYSTHEKMSMDIKLAFE